MDLLVFQLFIFVLGYAVVFMDVISCLFLSKIYYMVVSYKREGYGHFLLYRKLFKFA